DGRRSRRRRDHVRVDRLGRVVEERIVRSDVVFWRCRHDPRPSLPRESPIPLPGDGVVAPPAAAYDCAAIERGREGTSARQLRTFYGGSRKRSTHETSTPRGLW